MREDSHCGRLLRLTLPKFFCDDPKCPVQPFRRCCIRLNICTLRRNTGECPKLPFYFAELLRVV